MPVLTRRIAAPLLALALALPAAAASGQPVCQFATGGEGMVLTIVLKGAPGLSLRVNWGDGEATSVRRLDELRDRGYIRHEYRTAGDYDVAVDARDPSGAGCQLNIRVTVPYETPDEEETRALLPPPGAPDDLPDDEPPALPTVAPRPTQPSGPPGLSLLERILRAIGGAIGAVGEWLRGR